MERMDHRRTFEETVPAAKFIFRHVRGATELRRLDLDFDYALVDHEANRAVVRLSARTGRPTVWVSAISSASAKWNVTHKLTW
jgi:hypothetical protein